MIKLLATLIWMLLSLAGCDPHGRTVVERVNVDGRDVLRSEVNVLPDLATFHCIASSSGVCHYAIYAGHCDGNAVCNAQPLHQFGVRVGARLYDATQPPGFVPCVGVSAAAAKTACPGETAPAANSTSAKKRA